MNITNTERAALDAALLRQEIDIEDEVKDELLCYLHHVMEYNKILNLTRITNIEEAIVLHIEDSLAAYKALRDVQGSFIDIGTGGGFPGVPLALTLSRNAVLLDSVKKKADAVDKILHQMNKNSQIEVLGMRSEELAQIRGNSFDLAITRAVSSLSTVEEYCTPLVKMGGYIVSMRGKDNPNDIDAGMAAAEILGLELVDEKHFFLNDTYNRVIYTFQRIKESSIKLPRRNGMAHKRPLPDKK